MGNRFLILVWMVALMAAEDIPTPLVETPPLDPGHRLLAKVLDKAVAPSGVRWAEVREQLATLDRYRVQLARARVPEDRLERLALHANAYNAFVLTLVANRLPADPSTWRRWSIRNLGGEQGSPWTAFTFELAGERLTLDQIERLRLKPLGDPRFRFATCNASRSSPPLSAQPWLVEGLEARRSAASQAFAGDPAQVRPSDDGQRIEVNPLFDWFADDFSASGGVRAFLLGRTTGAIQEKLSGGAPIAWLAYDWTLNVATEPVANPTETPRP